MRNYYAKGNVNLTGNTGSFEGTDPFDGEPSSADHINIEAQWRITDNFQLGGWFGSTFARTEGDSDEDVTLVFGALTLAFPDLVKEGSLGGIVFGVPPVITNSNAGVDDDDTSILFEVFYRFQMNNNIAITPGLFFVTNPNHDSDNDTIWVGRVRTQFRF
ncbi:hypothetical protein CYANOKiyG1_55980 [Okeania sp. KiyG1]|nr:hypothetical protein CYANOKiyG1_55980 [Okeania sp. KiyG1]